MKGPYYQPEDYHSPIRKIKLHEPLFEQLA